MKTILLASLFVLSIFTVNTAQAESYGPWKHIYLTSRQGAKISLDYRTQEYSYYGSVVMTLSDLWIHVNKENLRTDAQVRAVLVNHPYYELARPQTQFFDFRYAEEHFVADGTVGANVFNAYQEFALVIDGEWQKVDFNSDNSNFSFRFAPYIPR